MLVNQCESVHASVLYTKLHGLSVPRLQKSAEKLGAGSMGVAPLWVLIIAPGGGLTL